MAASVLGIAGSPRRAGNSTTLLNEMLGVAQQAGLATEQVYLNSLSYKPCQACRGCAETGVCVLKDDMTGLYDKLKEAKVWILASPIYFDSVSAQLKSFFDRLYCLTHPRVKLPGVRRGAVIVTYEAKRSAFYEEVARRFAGYFGWFGEFEMSEVLAVPELGSEDAARNNPTVLAQAREFGQRLFADLP